jgi:hypothetical protein
MLGVPVGTKAAWCMCYISLAAAQPVLAVEAATGYTLSDITSGTNLRKYIHTLPGAVGANSGAYLRIHLDANGQFKWCTWGTNSTVTIMYPIDYEM